MGGAVIRIAFIIESLSVKISAKSQRKFAILTISDGIERFELPIWPDLYEEKAALLVENQLLYGVVQVERQEAELKLQCRWLDDLTRADEAMVRACDEAFDRAKNQVRMAELREKKNDWKNKNAPASKPKEVKMQGPSKLVIKLNLDDVRMSHILSLKKAFRSHPGATPVQLFFMANGKKVSSLHIDAAWGVEYLMELEEKIRRLQSIEALQWEY